MARWFTILLLLLNVQHFVAQNQCFVSLNNKDLVKYNPSGCGVTYVGQVWGGMYDIALTPSGKLYGTDSEKLFEIDTTDATVTHIAQIFNIGFGINNLIALDDEYLLALSHWSLYKIRCSDGQKTLVATDSSFIGSSGDITFYKGYFYLASFQNGLVRFKLNKDFSALESIKFVER